VWQFCSDEAVLKKAYFKLAKKHHPGLVPSSHYLTSQMMLTNPVVIDRNPENKVEAEQLFKRAAEVCCYQ